MTSTAKAENEIKARLAMKEGKKYVTTGLFRWKADWEQAANCYADAVKYFRLAGAKNTEEYVDALIQLSQAYENTSIYHSAAQSLDEAAAVDFKLNNDAKLAASRYADAARLYRFNNYPDKAISNLVKAGNTIGPTDIDSAVQYFNDALEVMSQTDRQKFSDDTYRQIIGFMVRNARLDDAIRVYEHQNEYLETTENMQYLFRNYLSIIIIHIARNEIQEAHEKNMSFESKNPSYAMSDQGTAGFQLIQSLESKDPDGFAAAKKLQTFTHLDNEVAKLVQKLKFNVTAVDAVLEANAKKANEDLDLS